MDDSLPPPTEREVQRVSHATLQILVVRCAVADALPLADWCDAVLGRDYFFKRRHIVSVLERDTNRVWAIHVADVFAGLCIVYGGSVLHNLYVAPEYRQHGVGSAVLTHFRPRRIRSKTNMLGGDPTEFYLRNGYVVETPDPTRPHILDMVLPPVSRVGQAGAVLAPVSANGVISSPIVAKVAPPEPPATAPKLDGDHVVLTLEQYNVLATLKKNRDRVAAYRLKRKFDKLQTDNSLVTHRD